MKPTRKDPASGGCIRDWSYAETFVAAITDNSDKLREELLEIAGLDEGSAARQLFGNIVVALRDFQVLELASKPVPWARRRKAAGDIETAAKRLQAALKKLPPDLRQEIDAERLTRLKTDLQALRGAAGRYRASTAGRKGSTRPRADALRNLVEQVVDAVLESPGDRFSNRDLPEFVLLVLKRSGVAFSENELKRHVSSYL